MPLVSPSPDPSPRAHEPLRRLVVPTDFSKGAELALARALRLPLAGDAVVHVVHVAPRGRAAKLQQTGAEARRALEAFVARVRAKVKPAATIELVEELRFGEPFVEVIRRSRDLDAELIVLGRHGRRPVRDMFIGTTAERVLRKGDVPVLVVNLRPSRPSYRRPLLAVGLDDTTLRVLGLVLRVTPPTVTTFQAVHAFNVPFEGFVNPTFAAGEKSEYRRAFQDAAKVGMAKLVARAEAAGMQWKTAIREGDPRSVILQEAARSRADLIALATHGRSGLAHALVGSVAEWIISQARCDVLVARPVRFSFELP